MGEASRLKSEGLSRCSLCTPCLAGSAVCILCWGWSRRIAKLFFFWWCNGPLALTLSSVASSGGTGCNRASAKQYEAGGITYPVTL